MALSQVKIEDCELSVRTARVLQENGYLTLGEVAEASDGQLLGLPQFGRRSLREIRDTIERFDKGGRERAAGKSIALAVFSLN
jgi:DNA-directed RNA polymerase alpha subunit